MDHLKLRFSTHAKPSDWLVFQFLCGVLMYFASLGHALMCFRNLYRVGRYDSRFLVSVVFYVFSNQILCSFPMLDASRRNQIGF